MFCARCGHFQHEAATFCGYCGEFQARRAYRPIWGGGRTNGWDAVAELWVVGLLMVGCMTLFGSWILLVGE